MMMSSLSSLPLKRPKPTRVKTLNLEWSGGISSKVAQLWDEMNRDSQGKGSVALFQEFCLKGIRTGIFHLSSCRSREENPFLLGLSSWSTGRQWFRKYMGSSALPSVKFHWGMYLNETQDPSSMAYEIQNMASSVLKGKSLVSSTAYQ